MANLEDKVSFMALECHKKTQCYRINACGYTYKSKLSSFPDLNTIQMGFFLFFLPYYSTSMSVKITLTQVFPKTHKAKEYMKITQYTS